MIFSSKTSHLPFSRPGLLPRGITFESGGRGRKKTLNQENSSSSTTLPKFNIDIAPEKLPGPNRKVVVFQAPFFRGYIKLRGWKDFFQPKFLTHFLQICVVFHFQLKLLCCSRIRQWKRRWESQELVRPKRLDAKGVLVGRVSYDMFMNREG